MSEEVVRALLRVSAREQLRLLQGPLRELAAGGVRLEETDGDLVVLIQVGRVGQPVATAIGEAGRGRPVLTPGEQEVYDLVRGLRTDPATANLKLTAPRIRKRLSAARGRGIGLSTLEHHLAKLVKDGLLVNRRNGQGYGLGPTTCHNLFPPERDFPAA